MIIIPEEHSEKSTTQVVLRFLEKYDTHRHDRFTSHLKNAKSVASAHRNMSQFTNGLSIDVDSPTTKPPAKINISTIKPKKPYFENYAIESAVNEIKDVLFQYAVISPHLAEEISFIAGNPSIKVTLTLTTDIHDSISIIETMFVYHQHIQDEIKELYIDSLHHKKLQTYTVSISDNGRSVCNITIEMIILNKLHLEHATPKAKIRVCWDYLLQGTSFEHDTLLDAKVGKHLKHLNMRLVDAIQVVVFNYPLIDRHPIKLEKNILHTATGFSVSLYSIQSFRIIPNCTRDYQLVRLYLTE